MIANVFLAKCITNLHVGNGDTNYSIIDQEVEKDPITGLPIINSSGVKGALKDFFEEKWGKNNKRISEYFGDKDSPGRYKFLQADMLFRPLRVTSDGARSYVLCTTEEVLKGFSERVDGLGRKINISYSPRTPKEGIKIEGEQTEQELLSMNSEWNGIIGNDIAVIKDIRQYDLPVIARNVLDDYGISKNLWYEQYVPRESIFGIVILTPQDIDKDFKEALTGNPVQFGGNASIGYGFMKITEVSNGQKEG